MSEGDATAAGLDMRPAPGQQEPIAPAKAGMLVLPEYGCGINDRANYDMLLVDFRAIEHTVLRPASPRQLRGGVGTAAPVIGVADHR